jgi:hypothetical protein
MRATTQMAAAIRAVSHGLQRGDISANRTKAHYRAATQTLAIFKKQGLAANTAINLHCPGSLVDSQHKTN